MMIYTTAIDTPESLAPSAPPAGLHRLLVAVRSYFARNSDLADLQKLDDRLLRDMGLSRYDIA